MRKRDELTAWERQVDDEIQEMFRTLNRCYEALEDKSGIDAERLKFGGYDANDKAENRIKYARGYRNSHGLMMPWYRKLVGRWRDSRDRENLTREDFIRILAPFDTEEKQSREAWMRNYSN